MARVIALIPDLLFGSRVQGDLTGAGHEVELIGAREAVAERLQHADVLVVDLTDERLGGVELVEDLVKAARPPADAAGGSASARLPRTLGFYSHVETATRARAEQAGFDLVVPRSRMAREGGVLVTSLRARHDRLPRGS
jgi:CheY-like chemotaxis protein